MDDQLFSYFVSCPRYIEPFLAEELRELGASEVKETQAGVGCTGTQETAYKICLWSRTASRLFIKLTGFTVDSADDIYKAARAIEWFDHFDTHNTFAIDAFTARSVIKHSNFASLRIKDGIADYFRARSNKRPDVDTESPDIRIYIHIEKKEANLYLDLSGESLHKRSYRLDRTWAPLRENTAAAILMKSGWKEKAKNGGCFIDPMCGSGTLAIEAALMAGDIAPGLKRIQYGFLNWKKHKRLLWNQLLEDALKRSEEGVKNMPPIFASDPDKRDLVKCRDNIKRAGVEKYIAVTASTFAGLDINRYPHTPPGLIVTNPPYGKRLGKDDNMPLLYEQLGKWLSENFPNFRAVILAGDNELARAVGLRAAKVNTFYNGTIKCALTTFELTEDNNFREYRPNKKFETIGEDKTTGVAMLVSRLKKNKKHIKKYLAKNNISCYRLYDADIRQHAASVDVYENRYVVVSEYKAPSTIDPKKAEERLKELVGAIPHVLEVDKKEIFVKQRKKQKGDSQYTKYAEEKSFTLVHENGLDFYANFTDYLDTGIFLDHRLTRQKIRELAAGKKFLNLYAYTCTATIYAAAGGAVKTVSVDTSNTYLEWGKKNLEANGFKPKLNTFVRSDCMEFLKKDTEKYGLIFIDPPTFSNRKGREVVFDIQRDHMDLIGLAYQRLVPGGIIIFSTNFRKFKMAPEITASFNVRDISAETIPKDYERNEKIHKAWIIREN